jgi:ABC-type transporter Mla maintaining outer membrane lipid asymmetry permease subunit MlaE
MGPVLATFADVIGTAAGYFVAVVNDVPGGGYIASLQAQVTTHDVIHACQSLSKKSD